MRKTIIATTVIAGVVIASPAAFAEAPKQSGEPSIKLEMLGPVGAEHESLNKLKELENLGVKKVDVQGGVVLELAKCDTKGCPPPGRHHTEKDLWDKLKDLMSGAGQVTVASTQHTSDDEFS